jgi:dihydrofolate reductase
MRRIVAGEFMSLDGVVERPDQWSMPYLNEEVGAIIGGAMAESDAMLLGRVTYQEWQPYWPGKTKDDDEFADFINSVPKFVVSSTLDSVDESWGATLLQGDLREQIAKLKETEGRDIAISGCITLVQWLLREGLLDRLNLLVSPIVVGNGRRLFENADGSVGLRLVDSKTLSNGVLWVSYALAEPQD